METNLPSSPNLMQGGSSYEAFELQEAMGINPQEHHQLDAFPNPLDSHPSQGSMLQLMVTDNSPFTMGSMKESEQSQSHTIPIVQDSEKITSLADIMKSGQKCSSAEEEQSFTEDAADDHNDAGKGKKAFPWQRVKWTDVMIRLLITAVFYIKEDILAACGDVGRMKYVNLPKKGKWKSISKVMAIRGHIVSPQQCEDKFNDLNKKYRRLNDILGRGTSCDVVENPSRLEAMDHISEKAKEEVRKILSTKQLHYEEMCSYHNRNTLFLPPDLELQRLLRQVHGVIDQDTPGAELENRDQHEENHVYGMHSGTSKKIKHHHGHEDNEVSPEGMEANPLQKQQITHPSQLEDMKLHIQAEMLNIQVKSLELEKERLEWEKISRAKDRELEMMRLKNEKMKLENLHLELELKQKEMCKGHK